MIIIRTLLKVPLTLSKKIILPVMGDIFVSPLVVHGNKTSIFIYSKRWGRKTIMSIIDSCIFYLLAACCHLYTPLLNNKSLSIVENNSQIKIKFTKWCTKYIEIGNLYPLYFSQEYRFFYKRVFIYVYIYNYTNIYVILVSLTLYIQCSIFTI